MRDRDKSSGQGPEILIVEDSKTQAELLRQVLEDEGYIVTVAGDGREALEAVCNRRPDVVLSDITMPRMDGYELCRAIKGDDGTRDIPVVLLSQLTDPGDILSGLSAGADGYLTKPYDIEYLVRKVRDFLCRPVAGRTGDNGGPLEVIIEGKKNVVTASRRQILNLLMSTYENSIHQNRKLARAERTLKSFNEELELKVQERTAALAAEIVERKMMDDVLRESESRYRRLVDAVTDYIYTVKVDDGKAVSTTHCEGCFAVTGYSPEECSINPLLWHKMVYEEDRSKVMEYADTILSGACLRPIEHRLIRKDGKIIWVKNTVVPHYDGAGNLVSYDGLLTDITDRKNVEQQLQQSQKLEALGRLAGGVAHDFNNCLTSIMGFTQLSMMLLKTDDPLYKNLEAVYESAEKAAGVTRQLLAFSRKQVIEPKVLNLNYIITDLSKMLRRVIGEDVEMRLELADGLSSVHADVTQMEQILINLAVNARDAMSDGGKLIIGTGNITLDEEYAGKHVNLDASDYVMLSVRDTGVGMSEEIMGRIFEPFFTTKEEGKGTGLGLSTVYGIVQQSGGQIYVYSEEGKGTVFKIYLPVVSAKAERLVGKTPCKSESVNGTETILVVEDDPRIRNATVNLLRLKGYTVFDAIHGAEALAVFERGEHEIDLVITDVVMPHMSGPELVNGVRRLGKDVKVLYMSGYTDDITFNHGLTDCGSNFIGKPFSLHDLLVKIHDLLQPSLPTSAPAP